MIIDPAFKFIDEQSEELIDFVFRLTADRGRAGVMGREACRQIKDELQSQLSPQEIRTSLFQRAYELNEEALRPIDKAFLETYYRHQHLNFETLGRFYRWELYLLAVNQYASLLLLLQFRFQFDLASCSQILGRELQELQIESDTLVKAAKKQKLALEDLQTLPRYGFLEQAQSSHTALTEVVMGMQAQRRYRWVLLLILLLGGGLGLLIWARPDLYAEAIAWFN